MASPQIFTVGHSDQDADSFVELLSRYDVTAVVDVRSHPGSSWAPQFNRSAIRSLLRTHNIRYAFMGEQLGVRSRDPSLYQDGRIAYARLLTSPPFREGLSRVARASADEVIAVMCSERDPLTCHRSILIAPALEQAGITVKHILRSGDSIAHADLLERLLEEEKLAQPDLFEPHDVRIKAALAKRERAIAWRDPIMAGSRQTR